jgi:hypothetical protein
MKTLFAAFAVSMGLLLAGQASAAMPSLNTTGATPQAATQKKVKPAKKAKKARKAKKQAAMQ